MIIYKIINSINDKIYIGQDSKNRPHYLGSGYGIAHAIKKYGGENFHKKTIAHCYTKEHLNFLEKFYIQFFNSKPPLGYNLTDGGEGVVNPSAEVRQRMGLGQRLRGGLSLETKQKMSIAKKGKPTKPFSQEHRRKLGEARIGIIPWNKGLKGVGNSMFGKHHSLETRKKIGNSHRGKPKSPEQNQKNSESQSHRSPETLQRMSDAQKGKHPSLEARIKMSNSQKIRWIGRT